MRLLVFVFLAVALLLVVRAESATYRAPWPWIAIADCETGADSTPGRAPYRARWSYDGRSGFDGGLQFLPSTWRSARSASDVRRLAAPYRYAWQAPASVQVAVARSWLRRTSWRQWPRCSRIVGVA